MTQLTDRGSELWGLIMRAGSMGGGCPMLKDGKTAREQTTDYNHQWLYFKTAKTCFVSDAEDRVEATKNCQGWDYRHPPLKQWWVE